jgi:hypothetical protein
MLARPLDRPESSSLPEQSDLQPQRRLLPWQTEKLVAAFSQDLSIVQLAANSG